MRLGRIESATIAVLLGLSCGKSEGGEEPSATGGLSATGGHAGSPSLGGRQDSGGSGNGAAGSSATAGAESGGAAGAESGGASGSSGSGGSAGRAASCPSEPPPSTTTPCLSASAGTVCRYDSQCFVCSCVSQPPAMLCSYQHTNCPP
jgi:hypothetical protein